MRIEKFLVDEFHEELKVKDLTCVANYEKQKSLLQSLFANSSTNFNLDKLIYKRQNVNEKFVKTARRGLLNHRQSAILVEFGG